MKAKIRFEMGNRANLVCVIATLSVGCYDLRGGSSSDAGVHDAADAADDTRFATDIVNEDQPSPMDAIDDAPDAVETMDASADASIDLVNAAEDGSEDAPADVPLTPDIVDAVADTVSPPCPMGLTRCGDVCVDTAVTPAHCGMCGMACLTRANAAPACVTGACRAVCNAGYADCDNDPTNGCEAALDRAENCGACGTRCQGGTPLCQESAGTHRCVSGCSGAASTRCGMSCVDTQSDLQHCGMCDRACPVPTNGRATCALGTCGIACNTGYHVCGTTCAPDTAVETCGTLCSPCPVRANATSTCSAASCGFACTTGFADCDGDASNGCEVDTRTTVTHCGVCNRACATPANGRATCAAGSCGIACNAGFANCDANATNGCETDLNAATTCGACDRACPVPTSGRATCSASVCGFACNAGFHACGTSCADDTAATSCGTRCSPCPARTNASATCAAGSCGFACNAGFADCDGDASNGCESPLDAATSCGACGTRCQGSTPLCQESAGTYRCVSGCSGMAPTRCGASCVDSQTDLQHCGACDNACAAPTNGRATCAAGTCGIACNTGYHVCGTTCADDTAVATCGALCSPCPTRANAISRCTSGSCAFTCNAGFADCDGNASNGCEVDTRTSTTNCGMCGRQCGPYNNADHACVAGACSIAMCHGATGDCNGNIADGCETALNTSAAHCGRCGNACPTRANATTTCTSGTCGFTCTTGFADCDGDASNGCEVDTRTSSSHCGMCARACAAAPNANAGCVSGACALTCLPGFGNCDGNASNGCETETRANIDHCGACGVVCGAGTTCRSGVCAPVQRSCQGVTEGCGTTLVTGGIFEMGGRPDCGGAPSDPACVGNALIRSGVVVSSFQLDAYEVSVARFRQFWAQRPSDLPTIRSRPIAYPGGETIPWSAMASVPESQSATCNWSPTEPTRLAHPMNCIDWWAAQEFCVWDGGRLPTDAEWEYAARGRSAPQLAPGRLYPWGDAAPSTLCDRAHWVGDGCTGDDGARTRRVGSFAPSAGLYDLAGNVQEWTADRLLRTEQSPCRSLLSTDPLCLDTALPNQVVRGGDYVNPLYLLRSATRNDGNPGRTYSGVGFRCARRTPTPRPVAPLSTATTTSQRPALKVDLGGWPNARVEICRDRACTMIEEIVDVVGRQARPATALAAGVHFWRVVGRDDGVTSRPSPTWEFFVGARSAPIDTSWGSVADFNGDGRPDLAVSAPGYQSNTGRVYVYLGTPAGLGSTPSTTLTGPDGPGSGFGYNLTSVASGGDVNGDGFADLVVSASPARAAAGRVYVYHGGPSGVATTPSAIIDGPDGAGASFGGAVAGASDFNGDGFADIVVGAPHAASQTGRVHLFLGSPFGLGPAPASSYTHPSGPGNLLGLAVAAGDVNGDGLGDVLVGSLVAAGSIGQARLFLGNSSAALGTPSVTISAPREGVFAASMACAGDVNGDGRADMIVGAYGFHAHVYLGASSGLATMSPITFATPIALEADFGGGVAGVGDLNGDGYDDVAVRAHQANGGAGSAFIYYGSASGPPTTPSITLSGTDGANAYFSYSMAGAADFNHDGYSDIPISANGTQSNAGRVYLFPGSATGLRTTPILTLTGPDGAGGGFGSSVARLFTPATSGVHEPAAVVEAGHVDSRAIRGSILFERVVSMAGCASRGAAMSDAQMVARGYL